MDVSVAADKSRVSDPVIFSGAPAFPTPLHVGRPNLGNRQRLLARIEGVLDRNWLTNNGPLVQEFGQRVAEFVGVEHCIALSSGTVALGIVVRALGLTGEVIIPSMTFVATAHALQWQRSRRCVQGIQDYTHRTLRSLLS